MSTTIADRDTLFATEDNQAVHEIGEEEGANVFVIGSLVLTRAKLIKKKGRWHLRGTIPLKVLRRS